MIIHYGYTDGSGEFYIIINAEKCNSCGKCIQICPKDALKLETILMNLEDKLVATVKEEHRKKIKYTCSPCKPESGRAPCVVACDQDAINCTWKPTEN
ncbi:MAG: 4Fe-4S binding protein [Candidatus Bathyarchaeota archaeon]|nr:MAG: 4Fe-4S binding protein [Candidatus Bathyarchaeota archaeon]